MHFKDAQLLIAFGYMSDTTRKLFFGQKFSGRHVRDRFDRDFRATLYSLREGLKRPITLVEVMVRLAIDERAIKALLSPTEFTTWFGVWNQEPWDLPKKYVEEMDFYFNPVHVVLGKPLEVWDFVAYSEATSRVASRDIVITPQGVDTNVDPLLLTHMPQAMLTRTTGMSYPRLMRECYLAGKALVEQMRKLQHNRREKPVLKDIADEATRERKIREGVKARQLSKMSQDVVAIRRASLEVENAHRRDLGLPRTAYLPAEDEIYEEAEQQLPQILKEMTQDQRDRTANSRKKKRKRYIDRSAADQLRREDEEALARMVGDNLDDESMAPMDDIEGIRTIAPVTLQVQIKDFSPGVRSIADLGSRISREKSTTPVSILRGKKKKKVNQVMGFSEEVERWQEEDCDTSDEFPQPTVSSVVVAAKATTADQDRLRLEERRVPSPITSPQGKRHCAEIEMEMGAGGSADEGVDLVDHVFGSLRRLYRSGEVIRDEVDEDGKPRTMHQAYYEIVSEKPMLDRTRL